MVGDFSGTQNAGQPQPILSPELELGLVWRFWDVRSWVTSLATMSFCHLSSMSILNFIVIPFSPSAGLGASVTFS